MSGGDRWPVQVDKEAVRKKAAAFRKLHQGAPILMLPNAWDVGSAKVLAEEGFPAIATTSAGIAFAQGYADGENIGREEMLAVVGRIVRKVPLPVTADLEMGYGPKPEDVAETVRRAIAIGAVGANFEDGTKQAAAPLRELNDNVERIRAAREAADAEDIPFVLNARIDVFLVSGEMGPQAFDDVVRRANAYRAAGADCLFVPGKLDLETIGRLVKAIDGPLNILGAFSGYSAPPLAQLQELGVPASPSAAAFPSPPWPSSSGWAGNCGMRARSAMPGMLSPTPISTSCWASSTTAHIAGRGAFAMPVRGATAPLRAYDFP